LAALLFGYYLKGVHITTSGNITCMRHTTPLDSLLFALRVIANSEIRRAKQAADWQDIT
jgi:hypothetical protein